MDWLVLIGRILFSVLFLSSAFGHLTQTQALAGYAKSKGVPSAPAAVIVTGLMLLVGGLMVLLGIWADLGALILAVFLLPTAFIMHGFWRESDPQTKQGEMVQFNKDLALGGASLMLLALISFAGSDLGLTITGPAFNIS